MDEVVPVCCSDVIGAMSCAFCVNGIATVAVLDTRSGISLLSEKFAARLKLQRES